jgi:hypothetical protein
VTAALQPVEFTAPLVAPASPYGLDAATTWTESTSSEALRWLPSGVRFRLRTHRATSAFGIWGASWCAHPDDLTEDDVKTGPPFEDDDPDVFEAQTVWASDRLQECGNLSAFDRAEVRERARQTFDARESIAVETDFATRMLADSPAPTGVDDVVEAVGRIEETFGATGTFGLIHARLGLLAVADDRRMIVRNPAERGVLRTPGGHRWVFGGGYATPLGDTLIATSPTYGWRSEVASREALRASATEFVAIVERSVVVGYEAAVAAVTIT